MSSGGSGNGVMPFRSNDKILDDESCRQYGSREDGKYNRNSRESRGFFVQKDWKGQSWENGASPNGPGRPPVSDKRSVDDMLTPNSHPHSDFVNTWDQLPFKDQHDKTGVNGLGTGQRFERETLGSIDWKPLKWTRSGSLSSRSSGFSHSSSSKGMDSSETKADLQPSNVTPVQSPSADAAACTISVAPFEETSSRKKPRLNWGEGLAKYEKKKVEGPEDGATKLGMVVCGTTEPLDSQISTLADKSPRVAGFSDSASPATPSSFACSSSPGVEDKPFTRVVNIDNDTSKLSGSPSHASQHHDGGRVFSLENLEPTPIANLSYSLSEWLQCDDQGSEDSSFVRSTAMNKLLLWKRDVLKALEMTESEIDSLETELKSLVPASGNNCPSVGTSSPSQGESEAKPCEVLVVASNLPRPAPLPLISSADITGVRVVDGLEEECDQVTDENLDSPGTVTSKFVEHLSSANGVAVCDQVKDNDSSGDLSKKKPGKLELKSAVCVSVSNEEKREGLSTSGMADTRIASKGCATALVGASSHSDGEDMMHELIMASNRDSANRASEVFNNVLPLDDFHVDIAGISSERSCANKALVKDKLAMRKRFLRFKERVITLKFRALHHLWKEDMQLLSVRKHRAKSQKRIELGSRILHGSYQKHRSSIRSRFPSPAGLSLVPTTEIINFTSRLLSDSQAKLYRNSLKMPALILDKKERIISRFISSNGLVEDPCAVEKERAMINPWTTEERELFMEKLATLGKDFGRISSFLNHKTTADCIEFYYKNHKADCFVKRTKNPEAAKHGKACFTNNYMVTSGKRWNRETNAASLDMLGVASAMASNADNIFENQQKCKASFLLGLTSEQKAPWCDDGFGGERSGRFDAFDNERESVAADVLAGICGSLSSEAMSSCITSSFEPGESYQDWKRQKFGLPMRQPLTPEVTQNVDDDICSDESCGEMDPTDWTDEEKSIFIQAVASYGKDFAKISRCVRTRSRNQCRVFFSKARKCLGLNSISPRLGADGMQLSDDADGGGTDNEDACIVETGSAIGHDKSGCKVDEDVTHSDLKMSCCESDFTGAVNLQTDLNTSEDMRKNDCTDMKQGLEHMVPDELQVLDEQGIDIDGGNKMEKGADCMSTVSQDRKTAVLPSDTVVEGAAATREGTASGELVVSAKEANDHGPSVSGAEVDTITACQEPAECVMTEPEEQKPASENSLTDKQDENRDAKRSVSGLVACTNAPAEFHFSPQQERKTALQSNSPHGPTNILMGLDGYLVNQNPLAKDPDASQHEMKVNQDTTLPLDVEKTIEKQCQRSPHQSSLSVSGNAEPCQILTGYPLPLSTKKVMNGDISSKKPDTLDSLKKTGTYSLSADSFLKKCSNSKAEGSMAELPLLPGGQKSHHPRPHTWSSSDTETPSRNGDVKLFGQILTHSASQKKQNGVHDNEDKGVQKLKSSSKSLNLKFTGSHNVGVDAVPSKFEQNNYVGLEDVPIKSYGFWDGNRIQTGFTTLPDSAILLAKYPAAFSSYSTSSSEKEVNPLHPVENSEPNLNGIPVFSAREMSSSNGVADHRIQRNQDSIRVQPFTVNMKQRHELLFSEMQRGNGFDAVSNVQQQARGPSGINVVGRGGILVGACTGVSDPVAAIKMHYAKAEQYSGQPTSISREDSWGGKGDIGR